MVVMKAVDLVVSSAANLVDSKAALTVEMLVVTKALLKAVV